MARPKAFDREAVLDLAIEVFSSHGFAGASTEALLAAMSISRQSMYDTFGDKHALFLQALQRYNDRSVAALAEAMLGAASGLAGIEAAFAEFVSRPKDAIRGCMGVMSTCEFGLADADVSLQNTAAGARLLAAFRRAVLEGQKQGEINPELDPQDAAHFLATTLTGLRVMARGGTPTDSLNGIVQVALRSLQ